jgi:hypothetical protein
MRRCMKCGRDSFEFALCHNCHANYNRVEGNVAVKATLAEIAALGPERAEAFLLGVAKILAAQQRPH